MYRQHRHPAEAYLTYEVVRQLLDYDPATGRLIWRERPAPTKYLRTWNTKYAGTTAGRRSTRGARVLVDRCPYMAHRLIWLWMTGEWPKSTIDHKNRDCFDNRWANLREASPAQQCQNRRRTTKLPKGVRVSRGRYLAVLGSFATPEEAHAVWLSAARAVHGEFFSVD